MHLQVQVSCKMMLEARMPHHYSLNAPRYRMYRLCPCKWLEKTQLKNVMSTMAKYDQLNLSGNIKKDRNLNLKADLFK